MWITKTHDSGGTRGGGSDTRVGEVRGNTPAMLCREGGGGSKRSENRRCGGGKSYGPEEKQMGRIGGGKMAREVKVGGWRAEEISVFRGDG